VETQVAQLIAKQEIHEVVLRYCRGVDRYDLGLVRSAYHDGAVDHHSVADGGFTGSVEEFLAWLPTRLDRHAGTLHIIANQLVELDGQCAVSECYGTTTHWGEPSGDPDRNLTTGSRIIDRMECRGGRWAIGERWVVREWTRSDVGLQLGTLRGGRRDREDRLYHAKTRAG
jgi:SnoaL-like domain